jgi:hypothetical protein
LRWKGSEELVLVQLPHGRIQNVSGAIGGSIPTDATILEQVFEERLRSLALEASPLPVRDAHSAMDVLEHLDDGRMAVLLNPCSIETLARIASTGGVVPPRSATFLPRPCCGIVAMPLHGW